MVSADTPDSVTTARSSEIGDVVPLVEEHAEAIYRVAVSIVRDPHLAEDVVQETVIKAWEALPRFRGESSLRAWVLRIAHNTSISALRRRRDEYMAPDMMPEQIAAEGVEARVEGREELARLRGALDALDDLSRSMVVLRELEGLSYQEISEMLAVPLPTVKTRLLRARRALQEALRQERGGER
ncbi:MAG: ECF RNA polymerase sigma factor SigH [Acidimicrobiales bacterium]|nr:ECF RNA polymerase sigma factor SigH [Acidimicrobiales bacterium]